MKEMYYEVWPVYFKEMSCSC